MLSLPRILIDGTLFSLMMGVIIIGSLYYNPRLWLQDYPKEMQARVPPLTPSEKRLQRLMMLPFMLVFIGWPLFSAYQLRAENGGTLPFVIAYLHVFFLANIFNLFDAVVIDALFIAILKPKFVMLPGTEDLVYLFYDWSMHLRNYLKGIVFCAIFSLPIAAVAML
jgi:hypothetical protein